MGITISKVTLDEKIYILIIKTKISVLKWDTGNSMILTTAVIF